MSIFSKVDYKGKTAKLEVFTKKHKLFTSLPVHKEALSAGLRLPKIYGIENKGNFIHKYTEWVPGETIHQEMVTTPDIISIICEDLGRYVNILYDINGITAVDSHFKNFVWCDNQVVYIDLKKLLHRDYEGHILQMSKICLKGCKGDRTKVISFLKGYSKYRDVKPILADCVDRGWSWQGMKGQIVKTESINLGEIV